MQRKGLGLLIGVLLIASNLQGQQLLNFDDPDVIRETVHKQLVCGEPYYRGFDKRKITARSLVTVPLNYQILKKGDSLEFLRDNRITLVAPMDTAIYDQLIKSRPTSLVFEYVSKGDTVGYKIIGQSRHPWVFMDSDRKWTTPSALMNFDDPENAGYAENHYLVCGSLSISNVGMNLVLGKRYIEISAPTSNYRSDVFRMKSWRANLGRVVSQDVLEWICRNELSVALYLEPVSRDPEEFKIAGYSTKRNYATFSVDTNTIVEKPLSLVDFDVEANQWILKDRVIVSAQFNQYSDHMIKGLMRASSWQMYKPRSNRKLIAFHGYGMYLDMHQEIPLKTIVWIGEKRPKRLVFERIKEGPRYKYKLIGFSNAGLEEILTVGSD